VTAKGRAGLRQPAPPTHSISLHSLHSLRGCRRSWFPAWRRPASSSSSSSSSSVGRRRRPWFRWREPPSVAGVAVGRAPGPSVSVGPRAAGDGAGNEHWRQGGRDGSRCRRPAQSIVIIVIVGRRPPAPGRPGRWSCSFAAFAGGVTRRGSYPGFRRRATGGLRPPQPRAWYPRRRSLPARRHPPLSMTGLHLDGIDGDRMHLPAFRGTASPPRDSEGDAPRADDARACGCWRATLTNGPAARRFCSRC